MTFFLAYLSILILPGALLSLLLGLNIQRLNTSVALSVAVFVAVLVFARTLGLHSTGFHTSLATAYLALVVIVLWRWKQIRLKFNVPAFRSRTCLIPLVTLTCVALYAIWAGPYTEVPADTWWHLGRINHHLNNFSSGSIGSFDELSEMVDKYAGYWYMLPAFVLYLTNTEIQSALAYLSFGNTLIFTAAVYSFTLFVFKDMALTPALRHATAASAVFFSLTQFGISVFSYPRYYVFAPAMFNFIVYMSAIACFIRFIRSESGNFKYILTTIPLLVTAFLVHMQEALFILVMAGLILLVETFTAVKRLNGNVNREKLSRVTNTRVLVLSAGFFIGYMVCHVVAYTTLARNDPLAHGVMADIRYYLPFLQNLYVLKPTFQFYQVLTVWGVFVYVLFVVYRKQLCRSPLLVGGMVLPAFTVFNPVFADLFLRVAPPEVLWRMCFLIPLPFVGAYAFVESARKAVREPGFLRKCSALVVSFALVALLLPFETPFLVSRYSKIYTIEPVSASNDHRLWKDLIDELNTLEPQDVITDPVTGYILNALTRHSYGGYKFDGFGAMKVGRNRYRDSNFKEKTGWLVIVNKRDGPLSETGRRSGHWPDTVLKVSKNYSEAFEGYINDHPDMFTKLWEQKGVAIYKITGV